MSDIKTIQDIFVEFEEEFNLQYRMSKEQSKAFNHIKRCRTEALGYHKIVCESCGYEKITYNSCKDRHCPLCQSFKKEQWINDRKSEVLGSKYFHVVLTLPKELGNIVLQNKRLLYSNMFKAAGETVKKLCKGIINDVSKEKFIKIINNLALNGAEGVVLGCTEIPLLINQEDVNINVYDTTTIHAISAVEFAIEN